MRKIERVDDGIDKTVMDATVDPNTLTIEEEVDNRKIRISNLDDIQRQESYRKFNDSRKSSMENFDPNDSLYIPSRIGTQERNSTFANQKIRRTDHSEYSINNPVDDISTNNLVNNVASGSYIMNNNKRELRTDLHSNSNHQLQKYSQNRTKGSSHTRNRQHTYGTSEMKTSNQDYTMQDEQNRQSSPRQKTYFSSLKNVIKNKPIIKKPNQRRPLLRRVQ